MCAAAKRWGVPDSARTVARPTVDAAIRGATRPVVIVSAPSGYGKTVAAARYCHDSRHPTAWLSMNGSAISQSRVLAALIRLLNPTAAAPESEADALCEARRSAAVAAAGERQMLLVLDDVAGDSGALLVDALCGLHEVLSPFVRSVLATTRHSPDDLLDSRRASVIDRAALVVTGAEASALAQNVGEGPLDVTEANKLVAAAGGHIALCRILLTTQGSEPEHGHVAEPGFAVMSLVEQLLQDNFSEMDRQILEITAMLKEASVQDIETLAGERTVSALRRSTHLLPLVQWDHVSAQNGASLYRMHDLVAECVLHRLRQRGLADHGRVLSGVLDILAERGDWGRIRALLSYLGSDASIIAFVERHGGTMQGDFASDELVRIIGLAGLQQAMGRPRFLLLWARALLDVGEVHESLAKLNAARVLAEHYEDHETSGLAFVDRLCALTDQGRFQDTVDEAERFIDQLLPRTSAAVRCHLLLTYAHALGGVGDTEQASVALSRCEEEAASDPGRCQEALERLERYRAHIQLLCTGDWATGAAQIPALMQQPLSSVVVKETLRGNLAWCFAEIGRLSSAQSILESLIGLGNDYYDAAYAQIEGMVLAAKGDAAGAMVALDRGAAAAHAIGAHIDYSGSLLVRTAVSRCQGMKEEALEYAEHALEALSREDYYLYSHLAAIEVAACMVALGDSIVALKWLPPSTDNLYYEVCKQSVLAVAMSRQRIRKIDLTPLSELTDFIQGGSINWRLAMYCGCFSELLGLLAVAIGVDAVPMRMLRMVPAAALESALATARPMLSDDEWRLLGERALGKDQFQEFLDRAGKPICRIRLFGGLEVTADGRPVTEKDWKKRKARVLFSMLALNNGQEMSRDVVFEQLWPALTDDKAKNNFYVAWSTMKTALMGPDSSGPCPYVESRRGRCKIIKEFVHTDIDDVDALLATVRQADAEGRQEDMLNALQELMTVYRGDLLPGDLYDDWFAAPRERYRFEFIDSMLKGAELLMERDEPYEALVFARRALMMDPFREDIYQVVLRCQILAGQRSAAIETFIQCKTQLAEELGLDPTSETRALYQQILAMEEKPRYDTYGLNDN